jgi:hypothetical protein
LARNFVKIFLQGGLGNQLFQYYSALYLAKKLGVKLIVDTNQSKFGKTSHGNVIANLGLPGEFLQSNSRFSFGYVSSLMNYRFLGLLHSIIGNQKFLLDVFSVFRSRSVGFDPELVEICKPVTLEGYFQTCRYFGDLELSGQLVLPEPPKFSEWFREKQDKMLNTRVAALHVRRGDYRAERNTIGLLSQDYFISALQNLERRNEKFEEVWIFTDDIEELKSKFGKFLETYNARILEPPPQSPPIESIILMSHASSLVTSNSTFSYWAGLLGSTNRVVMVPEKWFRGLEDPRDLYPKNWVKNPTIWESHVFESEQSVDEILSDAVERNQ